MKKSSSDAAASRLDPSAATASRKAFGKRRVGPLSSRRLINGQTPKPAVLEASVEEVKPDLAAITAERDCLADLYENAPVSYLLLDEEGRIRKFNRQAADFLGLKRHHSPNTPLGRFVVLSDAKRLAKLFRLCRATRQRAGIQISLRLGADRTAPAHIILSPNLSPVKARVTDFRAVLIDNREHPPTSGLSQSQLELHLQVEEQLRAAQQMLEQRVAERTAQLSDKLTDLEAVSYSLSHDMRAPLRSIASYSEILREEYGGRLDERANEFLRRMMASAERLDALIRDVLAYSCVARAPMECSNLDLDWLIDGIVRDNPALQPPNAQITIQRPLLAARGHAAFLTQAISNLLTNAVKFVAPGQKPCVRLWSEIVKESPGQNAGPAYSASAAGAVDTATDPLRLLVRLWVEDNGIGIAPEDNQRIFGMFNRLHPTGKYEGTGIGLAIVQKAAARMGGSVGVESALGKGSRFWMQLPLA